jgi:hypothetical protein
MVIEDNKPGWRRLISIRAEDGKVLGFGLTTVGEGPFDPMGPMVQRFSAIDLALHELGRSCDYFFGPLRTYPETL